MSVPPEELETVPPLGAFSKIGSFEEFCVKFWSQLVFSCFQFFSISHLFLLYLVSFANIPNSSFK